MMRRTTVEYRYRDLKPVFGFFVARYDGCIGYCWAHRERWLYLFPLPWLAFVVRFGGPGEGLPRRRS